jgi:hypothetical protein
MPVLQRCLVCVDLLVWVGTVALFGLGVLAAVSLMIQARRELGDGGRAVAALIGAALALVVLGNLAQALGVRFSP